MHEDASEPQLPDQVQVPLLQERRYPMQDPVTRATGRLDETEWMMMPTNKSHWKTKRVSKRVMVTAYEKDKVKRGKKRHG